MDSSFDDEDSFEGSDPINDAQPLHPSFSDDTDEQGSSGDEHPMEGIQYPASYGHGSRDDDQPMDGAYSPNSLFSVRTRETASDDIQLQATDEEMNTASNGGINAMEGIYFEQEPFELEVRRHEDALELDYPDNDEDFRFPVDDNGSEDEPYASDDPFELDNPLDAMKALRESRLVAGAKTIRGGRDSVYPDDSDRSTSPRETGPKGHSVGVHDDQELQSPTLSGEDSVRRARLPASTGTLHGDQRSADADDGNRSDGPHEAGPRGRSVDTDDDQAPKSLSLTEFVSHGKELLKEKQMDDLSNFVLTGAFCGRQYQVDPIKHVISPSHPVSIMRDYDSVLGFADRLYISAPITLHPIAKIADSLQRNVHIQQTFENEHVGLGIFCT